MEPTPTAKLLFQQAGPSDGTLAPFVLQMIEPAAEPKNLSTTKRANVLHRIIVVTPEVYNAVFTLVKSLSAPPQSPCPMGTLEVTSFEAGQAGVVYDVYPQAMLQLIHQLMRMLQVQHQ
jgi:hypothetical protein